MTYKQDITISDGKSFLICSHTGNIMPGLHYGYYDFDTRFISNLQLRVGGKKVITLTSRQIDSYSAIHFLTNSTLKTVREGSLGIYRARFVGNGLHEDLRITNFLNKKIEVPVTVKFDADFIDIFSVRALETKKKGEIICEVKNKDNIDCEYHFKNIRAGINVSFSERPEFLTNNKFTFKVKLEPKEEWKVCIKYKLKSGSKNLEPKYGCNSFSVKTEKSSPAFKEWKNSLTNIETDNGYLNSMIAQSVDDLAALHIDILGNIVPGAGIPWFLAVFGRDSIITCLQTLMLSPNYAKSVLKYLSHFQGREVNKSKDEEPGKIIHEIRAEETAAFLREPFASYYGTIDATLLYIILAAQYFHFTNDRIFIKSIKDNLYLAILWIYAYGDIDGDLFIEYLSDKKGLRNKGWKDSYDSINFKNGELAEVPISLVEVQSYAYKALIEIAPIIREVFHDLKLAYDLEKKASDLRDKFNKTFWMADKKYYALALDKEKKLVDSLSSNIGHALWSNIVPEDYAKEVVDKLLGENMFAGWGIRTLSNDSKLYNPISYHNGSIWPFDNSIIIQGFANYGFYKEAEIVSSGLIEASKYFPQKRLPELFSGFSVKDYSFPIDYPVSNTPQAWSSGSIFLMIQSLIGLRVNAFKKEIVLSKKMPFYFDKIKITNLHIGGGIIDFLLKKEKRGKVKIKIYKNTSDYKIKP